MPYTFVACHLQSQKRSVKRKRQIEEDDDGADDEPMAANLAEPAQTVLEGLPAKSKSMHVAVSQARSMLGDDMAMEGQQPETEMQSQKDSTVNVNQQISRLLKSPSGQSKKEINEPKDGPLCGIMDFIQPITTDDIFQDMGVERAPEIQIPLQKEEPKP